MLRKGAIVLTSRQSRYERRYLNMNGNTPDIILPNKPGAYRLGNVILTVTKDQLRISPDQQAIQQFQQQPQPVPVYQPSSGQVMQPDNTADRLQKSTLKTVDFLNKLFWG